MDEKRGVSLSRSDESDHQMVSPVSAGENERGGREALHSCGARFIHLQKHRQ